MEQPTFVAIIPHLVGGEGHTIPYHQAVRKAVKTLGWKYWGLIPQNATVQPLSCDWIDGLYHYDLEAQGNKLQQVLKIYHALLLGKSLANFLKKQILPQSQSTILFLERFIHLQLLAVAIAVWLVPSSSLQVWILYRTDIHHARTRWIYRFLNQFIQQKLPNNHFQLLTDSELLSKSLSHYFKETVTVLPIPHTDIQIYQNSKIKKQSIICWWAGSPREEKGWKIIRNLVNYSGEKASKICLVAAESSQLSETQDGILINLIDDKLSREDYDFWLNNCDIILLPYEATAYQERTSGIFVEGIIAGKIPLVSLNTWMSYELSKYNLASVLGIDWSDNAEIFDKILSIWGNQQIKEKLLMMQQDYHKFHTIDNYAKMMVNCYSNSR